MFNFKTAIFFHFSANVFPTQKDNSYGNACVTPGV